MKDRILHKIKTKIKNEQLHEKRQRKIRRQRFLNNET